MPARRPWRARFDAFTVNSFAIATDAPGRGVVAGGRLGPHQLWAWDRDSGELRQLTDQRGGTSAGVISADGRWVYYLDDPDAREEGILVRVPWEGGTAEVVDPDLGPGFLWTTATHRDMLAFTFIREDRVEHRIAWSDHPGSRLVVAETTDALVAALTDDGRTLVTARADDAGDRETVLYDVASGAAVARLSEPGVTLLAYTPSPIPGDTRMLAESNAAGVRRPMLWDRATGARTSLEIGDLEGDVRSIGWSPDGRALLLLQVHGAQMRFHVYDLADETLRPLAAPPGAITGLPTDFVTTFVGDDVLTLWQDGAHPPAVRAIPLDGGPSRIVLGDPAPLAGHPWRSVAYPSEDGTPIQAWLAVPDGHGPFPAVVDIHGGPGIAQFDWFVPQLQAFIDEGFAVLSVNYRGSSTFGTEFERCITTRPGELEVEDVAAGAAWLVAEGIADPRQIIVEGWSYGGYLALMALSARPATWAAGICGAGIADWTGIVADAAPMISQMAVQLHGGTPDQVPDRFRASSPITHADAVSAPLLVIHGRNDVRCPAPQMERYLARMAALGKDVTVEWFSGGHLGGVTDAALALAHTERMLAFARERIEGELGGA